MLFGLCLSKNKITFKRITRVQNIFKSFEEGSEERGIKNRKGRKERRGFAKIFNSFTSFFWG